MEALKQGYKPLLINTYRNTMDIDPLKAIRYMQDNAKVYAQAKANRIFIEGYLKTIKARLMAAHDGSLGAKEIHAYGHADYVAQLEGLREAVEIEETLRYMLEAAKIKTEIWKTNEYTKRTEMKNL